MQATRLAVLNIFEAVGAMRASQRLMQTLASAEVQASVYRFPAGTGQDVYHRHDVDQVFWVLQGQGECLLRDDSGREIAVSLKRGMHFLAARGIWHRFMNTGRVPLIVAQVNPPTEMR